MKHPIIAGIGAAALIIGAAALLLSTPVLAGECAGRIVTASFYGTESGNRTADGTPFDGTQMLAAHRTWPFGTRVRVTYGSNSIVVPIRDRGPFIKGRTIDLSKAAFALLADTDKGIIRVCLERL